MASRNYVNNPDMYAALCEYIEKCKKEEQLAEAENRDPVYPQIPNYIAECFMLIATKFANKPNFSGYIFKDEMIGDAIENCIRYIRNFDPDKRNAEGELLKNPFAYFTQYVKNAFLRRIDSEKRQLYFKYKNYQELQIADVTNGEIQNVNELNEISNEYIRAFEKKVLTNKKKRVKLQTNTVTSHFVSNNQ